MGDQQKDTKASKQKNRITGLDKSSALKVILPVAIGVVVILLMFSHEFENFQWNEVPSLSLKMLSGLLLALVFTVGRDFGMIWRFHSVTDGDLSWLQSLKVCIMCEFTSAITPSAVGGSAVGMFFMKSEGINLGRATTLMMVTIFLDELFFVVSCPIVVAGYSFDRLFGSLSDEFTRGLSITFWLIYSGIAIWAIVLFAGIIWKPVYVGKLVRKIARVKWLRRWEDKVEAFADNMMGTSVETRGKAIGWWMRAFVATAFSWVSRYAVVGGVIYAFVNGADGLLAVARQFVIWSILMVCPTPGGSGLGEWLFRNYYGDMIASASLALVVVLVWRIVTYYIYLLAGVAVIPGWLKRISKK